jgi:hypothetical protein
MIEHVVSRKIYFFIFGALMVLTGVTVWVANLDLAAGMQSSRFDSCPLGDAGSFTQQRSVQLEIDLFVGAILWLIILFAFTRYLTI